MQCYAPMMIYNVEENMQFKGGFLLCIEIVMNDLNDKVGSNNIFLGHMMRKYGLGDCHKFPKLPQFSPPFYRRHTFGLANL